MKLIWGALVAALLLASSAVHADVSAPRSAADAAAPTGAATPAAPLADVPTVALDGLAYVEAFRIAENLNARLETTVDRAYLKSARHVVTLTRDWARVDVDGSAVILDAPVRMERGIWLVPASFAAKVLPRLVLKPAVAAVAPKPAPQAPAVKPRVPPAEPVAKPEVPGDSAARPEVPAGDVRPPVAAAEAKREMAALPPPVVAPPAQPPRPGDTKLDDVRIRSYPTFTRVVIETSAPIKYRIESAGPKEVKIRLVTLAADTRADEVRDGLVEQLRLDRAGSDALLRVSFEGAPGDTKVTTFTDPYRLLFDFSRSDERARREAHEATTPLRTLVLDAGHGGHDSGAVGPSGLLEKELVLDVTRRVARLIEEQLPDLRVVLSRSGDHFVPLRERTSFANRERADLFVSIHANAHHHAASEGVETYFLSSEATDSAARQVAALENGSMQLERPNARGGRADIVKTILWDLAQSEFQQESSRLAEVVQDSMTRSLRIPNRGVKQAGFYVLGGAAMPAVLIEIGFVTNPKEERKLKDGKYRDEIARAIFAGIVEYKRHHDQRTRSAAR